jgi:hypothetical protein
VFFADLLINFLPSQEDLDVASSADQKAAKESFKSRAEEYKKGGFSLVCDIDSVL